MDFRSIAVLLATAISCVITGCAAETRQPAARTYPAASDPPLLTVASDPQPTPVEYKPSAPKPAPTSGSHRREIAPDEGEYIKASLTYLQSLNTLQTRVATAMVDVEQGTITLTELKDRMWSSQLSTTKVFQDYEAKAKQVPESFSEVHGHILRAHDRWQAGLEETMQYWDDGRLEHITSGQAAMKQSATAANDATAASSKAMKGLKKAGA